MDCIGSIDLRAWVADQRAQCERVLAGEMRADQPTKHHTNGWLACLICLEAKLDASGQGEAPEHSDDPHGVGCPACRVAASGQGVRP